MILTMAAAVVLPVAAAAQDYYDDDIYYNPKTAKKKATVQVKQTTPADYPAAGTYTVVTTGPARDIDEYNRRGIFAPATTPDVSAASDSLNDSFRYTRRIERFYNPDVVVNTGDEDLTALYYDTSAPTVNIYVNNDNPYYNPYGYWGSPWAYDPWYVPSYYNPWGYGYNWGPSWSWSWNWGPSWGWGPSWSWGWNWGPSWGWGPAWGWTGPAWGPGPATRPTPSRPSNAQLAHRYNGGSYRESGGSYRGHTPIQSSGTRPASRPANSGSNWNVGSVPSGSHTTGNTPAYRPGATSVGNGSSNHNTTGSYRQSTGNSSYRSGATSTGSSRSNSTYRSNSSSGSSGSSFRSNGGGSYRSSGGGVSRSTGGGGASRGGGGRR